MYITTYWAAFAAKNWRTPLPGEEGGVPAEVGHHPPGQRGRGAQQEEVPSLHPREASQDRGRGGEVRQGEAAAGPEGQGPQGPQEGL